MAKLLDLLEAELAVYREGGVADFDLTRDIMDYTTRWPERYHHPLENLLFDMLKDKGAEAEALAADPSSSASGCAGTLFSNEPQRHRGTEEK